MCPRSSRSCSTLLRLAPAAGCPELLGRRRSIAAHWRSSRIQSWVLRPNMKLSLVTVVVAVVDLGYRATDQLTTTYPASSAQTGTAPFFTMTAFGLIFSIVKPRSVWPSRYSVLLIMHALRASPHMTDWS